MESPGTSELQMNLQGTVEGEVEPDKSSVTSAEVPVEKVAESIQPNQEVDTEQAQNTGNIEPSKQSQENVSPSRDALLFQMAVNGRDPRLTNPRYLTSEERKQAQAARNDPSLPVPTFV